MISNIIMSEEVSAIKLLFEECKKHSPDMNMIDECIHRCCKNKEDINSWFGYQHHFFRIIHMASQMGHYVIITKLIDDNNKFLFPIEINALTKAFDRTPLHLACQNGCPLTVRTLLQHPSIEVNKGDFDHDTPLHHACIYNNKLIVMELLKHQYIQLNVTNNDSETPLHFACKFSQASVVQLLLKHETIIDINATDCNGDTSLHSVCQLDMISEENKTTIRILLEQPSIMIYIKNNRWETPFNICKQKLNDNRDIDRKKYHTDIVRLFEEYHIKQRWRAYCFLKLYEY